MQSSTAAGRFAVAVELIDGIADTMSSAWVLWLAKDRDLDPTRDDSKVIAIMERTRERSERESAN